MWVYIVTAEYPSGRFSIAEVFTTKIKAVKFVEDKSSSQSLIKYDIEERFAT